MGKPRGKFEIVYLTENGKRVREVWKAHKNTPYSNADAIVRKRIENLSLDGCSVLSVTKTK